MLVNLTAGDTHMVNVVIENGGIECLIGVAHSAPDKAKEQVWCGIVWYDLSYTARIALYCIDPCKSFCH